MPVPPSPRKSALYADLRVAASTLISEVMILHPDQAPAVLGALHRLIQQVRGQDEFQYLSLPSDVLDQPIDIFNFRVIVENILKREGTFTVIDLLSWNEDDLLDLRQFGTRSLDEVKQALAKHGWQLTDTSLPPPPGDRWIGFGHRVILAGQAKRMSVMRLTQVRSHGMDWRITSDWLEFLEAKGVTHIGDLTSMGPERFKSLGWESDADGKLAWVRVLLAAASLSLAERP